MTDPEEIREMAKRVVEALSSRRGDATERLKEDDAKVEGWSAEDTLTFVAAVKNHPRSAELFAVPEGEVQPEADELERGLAIWLGMVFQLCASVLSEVRGQEPSLVEALLGLEVGEANDDAAALQVPTGPMASPTPELLDRWIEEQKRLGIEPTRWFDAHHRLSLELYHRLRAMQRTRGVNDPRVVLSTDGGGETREGDRTFVVPLDECLRWLCRSSGMERHGGLSLLRQMSVLGLQRPLFFERCRVHGAAGIDSSGPTLVIGLENPQDPRSTKRELLLDDYRRRWEPFVVLPFSHELKEADWIPLFLNEGRKPPTPGVRLPHDISLRNAPSQLSAGMVQLRASTAIRRGGIEHRILELVTTGTLPTVANLPEKLEREGGNSALEADMLGGELRESPRRYTVTFEAGANLNLPIPPIAYDAPLDTDSILAIIDAAVQNAEILSMVPRPGLPKVSDKSREAILRAAQLACEVDGDLVEHTRTYARRSDVWGYPALKRWIEVARKIKSGGPLARLINKVLESSLVATDAWPRLDADRMITELRIYLCDAVIEGYCDSEVANLAERAASVFLRHPLYEWALHTGFRQELARIAFLATAQMSRPAAELVTATRINPSGSGTRARWFAERLSEVINVVLDSDLYRAYLGRKDKEINPIDIVYQAICEIEISWIEYFEESLRQSKCQDIPSPEARDKLPVEISDYGKLINHLLRYSGSEIDVGFK